MKLVDMDLEQKTEIGNPYLLRAIYWSIPRETISEWT